MARTVLITGASGNLGRKLRDHFATLGWTLRLLDIDPRGDSAIVAADLSAWNDRWAAQFDGVDAVVHLAGRPSPRTPWVEIVPFNIDLTINAYEAAARARVRRFVFASSNWVVAGHRFAQGPLSAATTPHPINPYGVSKLVGERLGLSYHQRWGLSVVCLRIGFCQRGENRPGPQMGMGRWGQAMWLSNRDFCHGVERAIAADDIGFEVLNLMSDNPGMRWDIDATKRAIGYAPQDGAAIVDTPETIAEDAAARLHHATLAPEGDPVW